MKWKVYVDWGLAFVIIIVLLGEGIYGALEPVNYCNEAAGSQARILISKGSYAATARKLLSTGDEEGRGESNGGSYNNTGDSSMNQGTGGDYNNTGDGSMDRIGPDEEMCTKDDILVFQGPTSPLPNGIPTYTVEVQNACLSESCSISDIHMSCGWFSSARLIDPRIFRRIDYDDCLLNDGEPLNPGEALSFQYANTFKYPLSVSSVKC